MRTKTAAAGLTAVTLVSGALLMPLPARASTPECAAFRPGFVRDAGEDATGIPVIRLTDRATARNPVTVSFDAPPTVIRVIEFPERARLFNFQTQTTRSKIGLYVRLEWPTPSPSDIDLYVYDRKGELFAWSEWWNNPVIDEAYKTAFPTYTGGHGGMGYESVLGYDVPNCAGITVLSWASNTLGEKVTLKVWLGKPRLDW